jgi:hypothetical protein
MSTSSATLSPRSAASIRSNRRLINASIAAFVALLVGAAVVVALNTGPTGQHRAPSSAKVGLGLLAPAAATAATDHPVGHMATPSVLTANGYVRDPATHALLRVDPAPVAAKATRSSAALSYREHGYGLVP